MKVITTDKTRTRRSMKIESAIEILSEILGSREEVIAVISTGRLNPGEIPKHGTKFSLYFIGIF